MLEGILEVIKFAGMLKRMPRMGWLYSGIPINLVENVAEHVMRTTLIALLFADYAKKMGIDVDVEKVLKMAIIHDLPEAAFMDVGGTARKILPRDTRIESELNGLRMILKNIRDDLRIEYEKIWMEYETNRSIESKIVKLADRLEMFFQAYEYNQIGVKKTNLSDFFEELRNFSKKIKEDNDIKLFAEIFDELIRLIEKK